MDLETIEEIDDTALLEPSRESITVEDEVKESGGTKEIYNS